MGGGRVGGHGGGAEGLLEVGPSAVGGQGAVVVSCRAQFG